MGEWKFSLTCHRINQQKQQMNIKTLTVRFDGEIRNWEIPLFRGAVIDAANNSLLFHNHEGEGYRYSYPLIQYKLIGNNPSIVCIDKGVESIGVLFENGDFSFRIGENIRRMDIISVKANKINIQLWNSSFNYRINKWLPLNPKNYELFNSTNSLAERILLLEKVLTNVRGNSHTIDGQLKKVSVNKQSVRVVVESTDYADFATQMHYGVTSDNPLFKIKTVEVLFYENLKGNMFSRAWKHIKGFFTNSKETKPYKLLSWNYTLDWACECMLDLLDKTGTKPSKDW